jgi:hypothetical protein
MRANRIEPCAPLFFRRENGSGLVLFHDRYGKLRNRALRPECFRVETLSGLIDIKGSSQRESMNLVCPSEAI